jgi:Zn-dependent protease with chaperone function
MRKSESSPFAPLALGFAIAIFALGAQFAAAADLFGRAAYPSKGRALDELKPASDYSDVLKERPRAVAIMRARAHGFVPLAAPRDYAKRVLARVLMGVSLPASFQPDVRILAAPDFNALCTPDGTVVISIGLLKQLQTEDELAFVLAHEISHAIYRHHSSDWFTRSQYYALRSASMLDEIRTKVQSSGAVQNVDTKNLQRDIAVAQRVYTLSEDVLAPQFQQSQEDQADALGLDLMVRAGYNPEAAQTFLERLQASEEASEKQTKAAKASEKPSGDSTDIGSLFNKLGNVADFALDLVDRALDEISKDIKAHRPASERGDLLAKYQFREYRNLKPSAAKILPWRNKGDARTAAVLANYGAADTVTAEVVAASGNRAASQSADAAAAKAIAAPTTDHAYTEYAVARYREVQGRSTQATAALNAAYKSTEPSWIAYDAVITIYLDRKDYNGASVVMASAQSRFEDSPVLLPKRIAILHGLRRDSEISPLLAQCNSYDIRQLRRQCEAAAGKT